MPQQTHIHIARADLISAEIAVSDIPALQKGEVLLAIDSFALTANNITYAVVGEQMKYWNFFPAGADGKGIIPVWGHATVAASRHADMQVGERVYGYLPMGSHVVVQPGKVSDGSFTDMAAHRQDMAAIYNQLRRLAHDPAHHSGYEHERALFEPLFLTSFLIEDMFRRTDWYGAEAMLLTSASSKTAIALAHVASAASPQVRRIGLTSPGNIAFVKGLGFYDEVLAYDAFETLDGGRRSVSVDFAGNGDVLARIHRYFGDHLAFSSLVGATHVDARGGAKGLAGPDPVLFFAPTAAETLLAELGPAGFGAAVAKRWNAFVADVAGQVTVERVQGAESVKAAYLALLAGYVVPARGLICAM